MEATEFTLRILILFLPGIIVYYLVEKLTDHKPHKVHDILLGSSVYGFLTYISYYFILQVANQLPWTYLKFNFLDILLDKGQKIDKIELFLACALAILESFFIVLIINRKWLYYLARRLQITKKHGHIDTWGYVMNSPSVEWALIRDTENNLAYQGWIESFSMTAEISEMFLRDVTVFENSTSRQLYETPAAYICQRQGIFVVEFQRLRQAKSGSFMAKLRKIWQFFLRLLRRKGKIIDPMENFDYRI